MANHTADANLTEPVDVGPGFGLFDLFEHLLAIRIIGTIVLLFGIILLGRLAKAGLDRSARMTAERNDLDPWKTRALISRTKPLSILIHISLFVAGFITGLYLWGLQTAFVTVLAAAGFAGIVIGMAASNTLSNLISGFIIFYNHPFDIGDWVEIDTHQGLIVDVKAGATVLETWDGEKVTIPNRLVEGSMVKNFSHQRKLRRRFTIGIDYATDIEKARAILEAIPKAHPEVLDDPAPQVIGLDFGDSSINLEVRYWIAPLRSRVPLIQTWIMQEVQRAFAKEGIVIPFPQRTMVWRFEEGNAPPGETVSTLHYDPETDTKPFPGPPLEPPADPSGATPQSKQAKSPLLWFQRRTETHEADAAKVAAEENDAAKVAAEKADGEARGVLGSPKLGATEQREDGPPKEEGTQPDEDR